MTRTTKTETAKSAMSSNATATTSMVSTAVVDQQIKSGATQRVETRVERRAGSSVGRSVKSRKQAPRPAEQRRRKNSQLGDCWLVEPEIRRPMDSPLLDLRGGPAATFENPVLEQDFIVYCQLASPVALHNDELAERRDELLDQARNHIQQPEFELPNAAQLICGDHLLEPVQNIQEPMMRLPEETQMLASLCTMRLLTTIEETSVLKRMHFLKHLAQKTLESEPLDQWTVARAEGLLRAAHWHRTLFVQCNMRLVVSILRKLPVPSHRYDELFSDGVIGLLRAIDKFDPGRGYRFCTYATTVIRRECFQHIHERQDENSQCIQSAALSVLASVRGLSESSNDVEKDRAHWVSWQEKLMSLIHKLSRREQMIIRSRYCLGAHRQVKTLQRLAAALKISKERVRQLEIKALNKLRKLAGAVPGDDLLLSVGECEAGA